LDSTLEVGNGRLQKGTEGTVHIIKKKVSWEDEDSPEQAISNVFQARLQGLYIQDNSTNKERDFMKLAKELNASASNDKERNFGLQSEIVYVVGQKEYVTKDGSETDSLANFQARLQGLYSQPQESDKERHFKLLAKAWNKSDNTLEVTKPRLLNSDVHSIERYATMVCHVLSSSRRFRPILCHIFGKVYTG